LVRSAMPSIVVVHDLFLLFGTVAGLFLDLMRVKVLAY
jgi:hypothetical protein